MRLCARDVSTALGAFTALGSFETSHRYAQFKRSCPTGMMTTDEFTDIFMELFPRATTANFAQRVFGLFDRAGKNYITFEVTVGTLIEMVKAVWPMRK